MTARAKGWAVVTGGSRGIGAAIAIELAASGFPVAILYLQNRDAAESVVESIRKAGGRAVALQADVRSPNQVSAAFAALKGENLPFSVLVNNAGASRHYALEDLPPEEWDAALQVHLSAAFHCARQVIPSMKAQSWGRIINIASLRVFSGSATGVHYSASKAGLIGLTRSLALALGPYNITVNAVSPGYTRTDMTAPALAAREADIIAQIPLRRIAEPHEIAALVGFLASDRAGYITGTVIHINGGIYFG
jgi:3-oxoacyl-[acyl-carrier protein] reductase